MAIALTNCQCSRQIKCSSYSGSRENCLAHGNDCQVVNFPSCGGAACPKECEASLEKNACVFDPKSNHCPRDSRTFHGGSIPADIEKYKFAWEKLSPFARTLAGKTLTKADVEKLTAADSDAFCSSYPGELCKLKWDESKQNAVCDPGNPKCELCVFNDPPAQCSALNKCNGVICL